MFPSSLVMCFTSALLKIFDFVLEDLKSFSNCLKGFLVYWTPPPLSFLDIVVSIFSPKKHIGFPLLYGRVTNANFYFIIDKLNCCLAAEKMGFLVVLRGWLLLRLYLVLCLFISCIIYDFQNAFVVKFIKRRLLFIKSGCLSLSIPRRKC